MRDINWQVAVTYKFNDETIWMMLDQIKMIVFEKHSSCINTHLMFIAAHC